MSRVSAGIVGAVSATVGAMLGAGVALEIHGDKVAFGPMLPREQKTAAKGAAIGGLLGAALGAGLSAGSDAPKQVGTSGALGLLGEWGVGASPGQSFVAGNTWQIDFESDKPVTPQQFFAFVSSYQAELGAHFDTVSFAPVDQTHFSAIVKWRTDGTLHRLGDSEVVDGVRFTVTDAKPYFEPAPPHAPLSTGAVVGIAAAGATALGGIVYVATRKPKRRRRS